MRTRCVNNFFYIENNKYVHHEKFQEIEIDFEFLISDK